MLITQNVNRRYLSEIASRANDRVRQDYKETFVSENIVQNTCC
jgi:hypothetical protein